MRPPPRTPSRPPRRLGLLPLLALALAGSGCANLEASRTRAQATLSERSAAMPQPHAQVTRYTLALEQFGRLLEVYHSQETVPLLVQSQAIRDATGLSHPLAGAELPGDITEMVRTAVNRIGPKVIYVPFDPDYITGQARQGARVQVTSPKVLITGALTEFDRGLASSGRGTDLGIFFGRGRGETQSSASAEAQHTISRLSIDFNLVDFRTQTMVPRMLASNSMRVLNESHQDAYDFAIYGNGFGLNTNTRYLQGRHNAIRLLVDLSIVQILGRYTNTPYWRCLPNARPDPQVIERVRKAYLAQSPAERVRWVQSTLRDYGFPLQPGDTLDAPTRQALAAVTQRFGLRARTDPLDPDGYVDLYLHVPLPGLVETAELASPLAAPTPSAAPAAPDGGAPVSPPSTPKPMLAVARSEG